MVSFAQQSLLRLTHLVIFLVTVVVARGFSDRYELQKVVAAGLSFAGITTFLTAEQYFALSLASLRPSSSIGVASTEATRAARKKDLILNE